MGGGGCTVHALTAELSPPPPSPQHLQFEYQQAQVEREIENLSWMTERAELDSVHVADLKQQVRVTEVQRQTLLRDFFV